MPVMGVGAVEQRRQALATANVVRLARAQAKRDLHAGVVQVADLLDRPDFQSMKVADICLALPRVGAVKVRRLLTVLGATHTVTVGGLTHRQRDGLVAMTSRYQPGARRPVG